MPRGKEDSEGKLVAIDAPYGSDRDAQIEILKEMFPSGMNFFTHNPWGSSLDELVRELPGWVRENPGRKPTYDLFPFFKLRVEYVEHIIGSQRKEGVNVFASPYMTPEWAAGAGVRRGSVSPLLSIYSSLPPALKPSAYIILDVHPGTSHPRMKLRAGDALAKGGAEPEVGSFRHYERVRDGFLRSGRFARKIGSDLSVISAWKDPLYIRESLRQRIGGVLQVEVE